MSGRGPGQPGGQGGPMAGSINGSTNGTNSNTTGTRPQGPGLGTSALFERRPFSFAAHSTYQPPVLADSSGDDDDCDDGHGDDGDRNGGSTHSEYGPDDYSEQLQPQPQAGGASPGAASAGFGSLSGALAAATDAWSAAPTSNPGSAAIAAPAAIAATAAPAGPAADTTPPFAFNRPASPPPIAPLGHSDGSSGHDARDPSEAHGPGRPLAAARARQYSLDGYNASASAGPSSVVSDPHQGQNHYQHQQHPGNPASQLGYGNQQFQQQQLQELRELQEGQAFAFHSPVSHDSHGHDDLEYGQGGGSAQSSGYAPPVIEDPEDHDSDSDGEAPASIQFEIRSPGTGVGGVGVGGRFPPQDDREFHGADGRGGLGVNQQQRQEQQPTGATGIMNGRFGSIPASLLGSGAVNTLGAAGRALFAGAGNGGGNAAAGAGGVGGAVGNRLRQHRPLGSGGDLSRRPLLGGQLRSGPGGVGVGVSSPLHEGFRPGLDAMPPLPTGGLGSAGHGGGGNQPNQFYQRPSAAGAGAARQAPTDTIRSWRDVRHLDVFLTRIYQYYTGKGFLCIILNSVVTIATAAFVIFLSTFLFACINYDLIHEKKRLSDIIEPNCIAGMSFGSLFVVAMFGVWWILQVIRLLFDIPRHREMQHFFTNVLGIMDDELQNTLWRDVVAKIVQTRAQQSQANPTAALRRLDAHAIANRILRKDNYLIALFNKDILNLSVPLFGSRQIMSKLMEWNLSYCIFSYVFDDKGVFRKRFLKENNRARLVDGLQKRFRNMAYMNLLLSPFLLIFLVLYSFFKYAEEYQRNPSGLGARQYSPFAWWKFREFNELPHLLQMRLNRSTDNANTYIRQFPKEYLIILAKFVSFVSGSLAAILLAITLFEEELQQGFEITPGRSAFFYIGIFGAILALSRGLIPPDTEVFEPERWMREVALDTHYMPDEWRSRAHTDEVKQQFEALYDFKLALWAWELLSVVLAPAVLYYSLPPCAEEIVDFFREFTVHVEAYGYVCSFAVFDFKRHGNVKFGVQPDGQGQVAQQQQQQQQQQQAQTPHFVSKEGKMEHSFVNFKANYPNWDPGLEGSEYISRLLARRRAMRPSHLGQTAHSFHGATPSSSHGDGLGQSRHDFMPSASMEATAPHMQYDGGLNGYGAGHGAGQDMMMESYLRGEQSVMQASHIEQRIGRELFGLLDAVYETNRRLL